MDEKASYRKSMRHRFLQRTPFLLWCILAFYVVVVEMRPGRFYYITSFLLFRDSLAHLFQYLILFGGSVLALVLLIYNRSSSIFWVTLSLLFPCLFISIAFRLITGYNFMYADAVLALNNLSLANTALQNFAWQIGTAFGTSLLVLATISWGRNKILWRATPWTSLLLPVMAMACYLQIKGTTGVIDDFPALYRVPLTVMAVITDQLPQPERTPVTVSPVKPSVPHLFLIVDESITATELTLQNPDLQTTPFLYSVRDQLIDFGVTSSITNQSAGSNIALMSGTRFSELPDTAYKTFSRSTIFQFAQKAGYTTYLIDAQQGGAVLQNFMSPKDLIFIDHVERPAMSNPELPYHDRDMLVAARLAQLAKKPFKVFAYVVKVGAHWPYGRTYPADSTYFKPVLSPRNIYRDPERTLNTYHNSLRWTVDHFWRQLMHTISPADSTVVVYTSDHGQNLTLAGLSLTHASVHETSPQEAAVPLWIWDPSQLTGITSQILPSKGFSHAYIFPTLLRLQGFAPLWVREHYGPSLLEIPPEPQKTRYFMAGDLFGRGTYSVIPFD